jgi:hypothetical protein
MKCAYPECEHSTGCYDCNHCWIHCACTTYYPSYDEFKLEYMGIGDDDEDDPQGWIK